MPEFTITISTELETFMNERRSGATIEAFMEGIILRMMTAQNDGTIIKILGGGSF